MKKIMFNDKYGLTNAVLSGKKTMTRRFFFANIHEYNVIRQSLLDVEENQNENRRAIIKKYSRYQVGEIVAVAQSYESMANGGYLDRMTVPADNAVGFELKLEYCGGGYKNKMFVSADLMPHHIYITDIKIELLQDISDEDCLKEGLDWIIGTPGILKKWTFFGTKKTWNTRREAFAALIDKVSGKGTWENNPYVFAYSFKLID